MCAATALICGDTVLALPFCIQAAVTLPGRVFFPQKNIFVDFREGEG